MRTIGTKFALCDKQEGESAYGFWMRATLVVNDSANQEKPLAIKVFGERQVKKLEEMKPGTMLEVKWHAESREFDGRWYTNLQADSIRELRVMREKDEATTQEGQEQPPKAPQTEEELPF